MARRILRSRRFRRANLTAFQKIGEVFQRIIGSYLGIEQGRFTVAAGNHEITVPLKINTSKVWAYIEEGIIDGCAQVPVNKIGYRLLHKKIVFFVDAQTDTKVQWYATESPNDESRWGRWDNLHCGGGGRGRRK